MVGVGVKVGVEVKVGVGDIVGLGVGDGVGVLVGVGIRVGEITSSANSTLDDNTLPSDDKNLYVPSRKLKKTTGITIKIEYLTFNSKSYSALLSPLVYAYTLETCFLLFLPSLLIFP